AGTVLEDDPLVFQAGTDGVGFLEVLALAGIVACLDRGFDVARREPRALLPRAPARLEVLGRAPFEEPDGEADATELPAHDRRERRVAGIERAVELPGAVEEQADRLGRVQVVVHGGTEFDLERA